MRQEAGSYDYTDVEIELWNRIREIKGRVFRTKKGLEFRIEIKHNKLLVGRRLKPITCASVNMKYKKRNKNKDCEPKAMGFFGSSYLWGLFRDIEL